jgi:hypothetical protein
MPGFLQAPSFAKPLILNLNPYCITLFITKPPTKSNAPTLTHTFNSGQ